MTGDALDRLVNRAERVLARAERLLGGEPAVAPEWTASAAWRWHRGALGEGRMEPVANPAAPALDDLIGIARQRQRLETNTRQLIAGLPANNALLWGPRGTGKSSLVRALLRRHSADGLRLIEVAADALTDLPRIAPLLAGRPERFIIYCDDLSLQATDATYQAIKVALDGSLGTLPDNTLIYATSNRRHLVPEAMRDNLDTRTVDGEVHPSETVEQTLSLSERFGLWLAFHPFDQEQYLAICAHWVERLGDDPALIDRQEALRWALARGSRSGRTAWQFARHWVGSRGLDGATR